MVNFASIFTCSNCLESCDRALCMRFKTRSTYNSVSNIHILPIIRPPKQIKRVRTPVIKTLPHIEKTVDKLIRIGSVKIKT